MLGRRGLIHSGGTPRCKAAEVKLLMEFALDVLNTKGTELEHYRSLNIAGQSLKKWILLCRTCSAQPTPNQCQAFADHATRHLLSCQLAGILEVPKHHLFAHLATRTAKYTPSFLMICYINQFQHDIAGNPYLHCIKPSKINKNTKTYKTNCNNITVQLKHLLSG